MMRSDSQKEKTPPAKETSFSIPTIPVDDQLEKMKNRLKYNAVFPGFLIGPEYKERIGNAVWLLLLVQCACDWDSGVLRGVTQEGLAKSLGVKSARTIRNWLQDLGDIGVVSKRHPYSTEIRLPDHLIPNVLMGKSRTTDKKSSPTRKASPKTEKGKGHDGPQHVGSLLEQYRRLRSSDKK